MSIYLEIVDSIDEGSFAFQRPVSLRTNDSCLVHVSTRVKSDKSRRLYSEIDVALFTIWCIIDVMTQKRKKEIKIRSASQVQVLASAVSIEIIHAIRSSGPTTIAELGPRMGRKPNSLHYHVRKLRNAGFLHETGTKRSGARTQSIYDVTAVAFKYEKAPKDPALRKHANGIVTAMLRLASRSFAWASQRSHTAREFGAHANLLAERHKARLTRAELAEVNKHLRAAREVFFSSNRTCGGELCVLTLVLTPEPDRGE